MHAHTCTPLSFSPNTGWPGTQLLDAEAERGCGEAAYLQQHHVHGPVHLGDVAQAVAPLVPFIHFVQTQKRGHEMQERTPCNLGGSGCARKPPGLSLSRGAGWGFCRLDSSMKKTSRGSNHAEPQVPHGMENFLAVPEPRGDAHKTHSIHSKRPSMLYFSQISTEREAQTVSIKGDNSRRKMKA